MSKELQKDIEKSGTKINPLFCVKKNQISIPENTTQSYIQYSIDRIIDDIKEASFKFADVDYDEE